jgi:hypothetical protein
VPVFGGGCEPNLLQPTPYLYGGRRRADPAVRDWEAPGRMQHAMRIDACPCAESGASSQPLLQKPLHNMRWSAQVA